MEFKPPRSLHRQRIIDLCIRSSATETLDEFCFTDGAISIIVALADEGLDLFLVVVSCNWKVIDAFFEFSQGKGAIAVGVVLVELRSDVFLVSFLVHIS